MARAVDRVEVHRRLDARHPRAVLDVGRDRVVGELLDEVRLPVVLQARREQLVERAVQRRVGHRPDTARHRPVRPRAAARAAATLLDRARPAGDDQAHRLAVALLGDERQRRSDLEREERAQLLRRVGDELAVDAHDLAGLIDRVEDRPAVDVVDRVQAELERGDDAEVAAAAAQRPEQVRRSRSSLAVTSSPSAVTTSAEIRLSQREAAAAREVADAAAERQPPDAGRGDDPAGGREAVGVRRGVEIAPGGAALDAGGAVLRDRPRRSRIAERSQTMPSSLVPKPGTLWPPPRTDEVEPVLAGAIDGGDDVLDVRALRRSRRDGGRSSRCGRRRFVVPRISRR